MCRIAAYLGPPIPLERIIVLPRHSLLEQSRHAREAKLTVNGDGFGIAWYAHDTRPGQYRDVLPAWSDGNLTSLCRTVVSRLFLAHVRASTVGGTTRTNCHPFTYGRWSFMHNGQLADFGRIRRGLEATLPDELYAARQGSTDSELLFLLMLAQGLDCDPKGAAERAIRQVFDAQGPTSSATRMTCAFSNGADIFAFRLSSDCKSPSLYLGQHLTSGGAVLASERLDSSVGQWTAVEEGAFGVLSETGWSAERFSQA